MTGITHPAARTDRAIRFGQLLVTLVIGVLAGATATFELARPAETQVAAPAAPRVVDVSTTSAGKQYVDWYLRPAFSPAEKSAGGAGSTTATDQYIGWYTRNQGDLAGSTSASDQYHSWFTRSGRDLAGSTSASEQYQAPYRSAASPR